MTEKNRQKAHLLKDLRLLIASDFFYFRAKITFADGTELCCYGDEHSVTYKQCLHGFSKEIQLDAVKGYSGLVNYIEVKGKGGVIKIAKVYGRDNLADGFNTQHRVYVRGKWQEVKDPIIPAEKNTRILDFTIEKGRVEITGLRDDNLPDFKEEVSKALAKEKPAEKAITKKAKPVVKKTAKKSANKASKKQDHSIY